MGKLPKDQEAVELLAVKTIDIDSLGENNPVYSSGLLPDIPRKIQLALISSPRLVSAGRCSPPITDSGGCRYSVTIF